MATDKGNLAEESEPDTATGSSVTNHHVNPVSSETDTAPVEGQQPRTDTPGVGQPVGRPASVQFSAQEFSFGQAVATSAEITVARTGNVSGKSSVDYKTSDVSAVAGIDYSPAQGAITFNSGEAQKRFNVGILKQPTAGKTNLLVELLNPQGAELGNPNKAVLTICPALNSQSTPRTTHWSGYVLTLAQYLIFATMGTAFVYFIITTGQALVTSKETGLNTVEAARSLITFLIAACTVGIALILTFSSIIGSGPDVNERFSQGKEILTILIGVLGTIVGFYFGQATKSPSPAETSIGQSQNLQISPPTISKLTPAKGEKTTIGTKVTGGRPPYKYTIIFTPSEIVPDVKDGNSADGTITQEVTIPDSLAKDTPIKFTITVKDADGKSVTYDDPSRQFTAKVTSSILGTFLIPKFPGKFISIFSWAGLE